KTLDSKEIKNIESFFESALVEPYTSLVAPDTVDFVSFLIENLERDFSGMYSFISQNDEDDSSKLIEITFIEGNNFHTLELFWSID
ncbi:hypothetical protein, partial [Pseudoalteromonas sp.]|uniref:hypothetical protein n=1 Tax=Pseudoalteromonas sp. TaxID=53249 RepID=UPI0030027CC9